MALFMKKSGSFLCFDLQDGEVRIAVVKASESGDSEIADKQNMALPAGLIRNGHIEDAKKLAAVLKPIIDKFPKNLPVGVALPHAVSYTAYVINQASQPKNRQTLLDIAEEWFPETGDQMLVESIWLPTGGTAGTLALFGVATKIMDQYRTFLRELGIASAAYFPKTMAVSRMIFGAQGPTKPTALLDATTAPLSVSCIAGLAVIDERVLYGDKVEEAYCETLQSWIHRLPMNAQTATSASLAPATDAKTASVPAPVPSTPPAQTQSGTTSEATDGSLKVVVLGTAQGLDVHCPAAKSLKVTVEALTLKDPEWTAVRGIGAFLISKNPPPKFT